LLIPPELPPPHETSRAKISNSAEKQIQTRRGFVTRSRFARTSAIRMLSHKNINNVNRSKGPYLPRGGTSRNETGAAPRAVVDSETVATAGFDPSRFAEVGETAQVEFAGAPKHEKVIDLLNPLIGAAVS
jgi:hypothetical protein